MVDVVQVTKYYPPFRGGVPNYVQWLSQGLAGSYRVTVLTSNTRAVRVEEIHENLRVIYVPRWKEVRSTALCPTLPWELSRCRADIVHLHFPDPMAHLAFALAGLCGKLVISWHGDITRQSFLLRFYRRFLRRILRRADAIVVGSPTFRDGSHLLEGERARCVVIPYGIDPAKFEPTPAIAAKSKEIRERYGDRTLLFVGRLIHYKGLEYLLRAMPGLEAKLLVAGIGYLDRPLRRLAAELGVQGKVEFLGEVSPQDLVAHLHACTMLVLPSINSSESYGIVQLEAMACSKPVVSTNLPTGVPWVNQDGRTGFVVPPCDSPALASAIRCLLDSPRLRHQFGAEGRRRVESEFTHELHVRRMLDLYWRLRGRESLPSAVGASPVAPQAPLGQGGE